MAERAKTPEATEHGVTRAVFRTGKAGLRLADACRGPGYRAAGAGLTGKVVRAAIGAYAESLTGLKSASFRLKAVRGPWRSALKISLRLKC